MVGVEALHGADRLSVVAEFAVVVVLDDDAIVSARPPNERCASSRLEGDAGRVLVGGGHDGDLGAETREVVDLCAVVVDRQRDDGKLVGADDGTVRRQARVFQGHGVDADRAQCPPQQGDAVGEPAADHHALR